MRDAPPEGTVGQELRTLGALCDPQGTTFRVWAPDAAAVELVLCRAAGAAAGADTGDVRPLRPSPGGYWTGRFADVGAGHRYKYRLDGDGSRTFPDPASRFQPEGVHGPSEVVDPSGFRWSASAWTPPPLEQIVLYELHVGTFSPEGTYTGAIARLPHLVDLGVTAIELMPVGDFPGERNWGYDGVAIFAPARAYGTPDDLRALVDAAHRFGLAVLLDVVYNHLGPDGAYANAFSTHYFSDAHSSPWGRGVNLDGPHSGPVRRFFIENAVHWIREYRIDGLRLDATHALHDDSPVHFLRELADAARADAGRPILVTAEDHRNLSRMLMPPARGGFGLDAVWADDFHHQARVHTAGDREGYYEDFSGSVGDLATTLRQGWFFTGQYSRYLREPRGTDPSGLAPPQFVVCIQNHDQIGNRADGARLHHEIDPAVYRALSALLLLAPQTPLLFMGQEWGASSPFQFFTDHGEELGRKVTEGRRQEFAAFAAFTDPARRAAIPDPQQRSTFERSRLDWEELTAPAHGGVLLLYRRLLRLRRATPALVSRSRAPFAVREIDAHTLALAYGSPEETDDGALLLVARVSGGGGTVQLPVASPAATLLTTEDEGMAEDVSPPSVQLAVSADGHSRLDVRFARPGAVALRATLG